MFKILSKLDGKILLHIVFKKSDFSGRMNLIDETEFLQVSTIATGVKNDYRPHIHLFKSVEFSESVAQEAWVVIQGRVVVDYFDLDGSFLETQILEPGDCSITLYGGHGYHTSHNAIVYEFKTGPYLGIDKDKKFIDEMIN